VSELWPVGWSTGGAVLGVGKLLDLGGGLLAHIVICPVLVYVSRDTLSNSTIHA